MRKVQVTAASVLTYIYVGRDLGHYILRRHCEYVCSTYEVVKVNYYRTAPKSRFKKQHSIKQTKHDKQTQARQRQSIYIYIVSVFFLVFEALNSLPCYTALCVA